MLLQQDGWPSEVDLERAEEAEFLLLCRVLVGLRRLPPSGSPPRPAGAMMSSETSKLVDALRATQTRVGLLVRTLQDGTSAMDEQLQVADRLEELLDLLQSHVAVVNAGIAPTSRHFLLTERYSA
jgi:hypothetical protein